MRLWTTIIAVVILLAGCLTEPPEGDDGQATMPGDLDDEDADGEDDADDADDADDDPTPTIQPSCTTPVDLAFMSRIQAPPAGVVTDVAAGSIDGLALFINRGNQPLDLSGVTVVLTAIEPGADVALAVAPSSIALPGGEAHGVLPAVGDDVVRNRVPEPWSSHEAPGLLLDLEHTFPAGAGFGMDLDVRLGPLLFPLRITVDIVDGAAWTPVASTRIPAICDGVLQPN